MTSSNKGTNMATKKAKLNPAEGIQEPGNEFAPHIDNNGDGTFQSTAPAKTPAASLPEESPPENAAAARDDAGEVAEEDFLDYVNNVLKPEANKLGFHVTVTKVLNVRGPSMFYHRVTREGKGFDNVQQAGPDYMTGDELRDLQEAEQRTSAE